MIWGNALAPNRWFSLPGAVRLSDKDITIKRLFVLNGWNLDPLGLINGLALVCYQPSPLVLNYIWPTYNDWFSNDFCTNLITKKSTNNIVRFLSYKYSIQYQ